jgi:dienelactone hydrolase
MRLIALLACVLCALAAGPAAAQVDFAAAHLADTQPLQLDEPLDVVMVRGINYFAERELADAPNRRGANWNRDYSSAEAYEKSVAANRERLKEIIGAVDPLVENPRMMLFENRVARAGVPLPESGAFIAPVTWDVMEGVTGEGYLLSASHGDGETPNAGPKACLVVIPDAGTTPEAICGLDNSLPPEAQLARRLAENGCEVLVVAPINRDDAFAGHDAIRFTNLPHREFIYRMAFEMGRHIVGYEVQKVRAGLDVLEHWRNYVAQFTDRPPARNVPLGVVGIGEGGLIALYAGAVEPRFDVTFVSGYFGERENVWQEPIYRNVWDLLTTFGDADITSLIAPRRLIIEAAAAPETAGPPPARDNRSAVAAPGRIVSPTSDVVTREGARVHTHYSRLGVPGHFAVVIPPDGSGPAGSLLALQHLLGAQELREVAPVGRPSAEPVDAAKEDQVRQKRQIAELNRFTQALMHRSDKARDKSWASVDRSSVEKCVASLESYRDYVYDNMIGRLPEPAIPLNPRTRKVIDEPTHVGYEVVLDCYPAGDTERPIPDGADVKVPDTGSVDRIGWAVGKDWGVIAGGILLLPRDLKAGERRPVVVCQHGLEGTPMDTIVTDPNSKGYGPYKGFSTALVKRGFIVYVPQNPYRGHDAFRVIQRKSNPLGRSLFSYIIPQHARTLEWLASLPYVDPERLAFYGLSYGGKTAMRVPPMLVPGRSQESGARSQGSDSDAASPESRLLAPGSSAPGYCLSICSADFNEWVRKNASSEDRYSYVYTGEYEIFEWNMGHVANYAELAYLMTPRPFMVERGHDDGVAPDEWVAWEYAKVKRHYDRIGLGDRCEMEVFNGPHTINGVGTFAFLHKHLNWPAPEGK